jgi:hypothetical protein
VTITSNQGKLLYRKGELATFAVRASDAGGLKVDPSDPSVRVTTASSGVKTFTATAEDNCGNRTTRSVSYRVAAKPRISIGGVASVGCTVSGFRARIRVRADT